MTAQKIAAGIGVSEAVLATHESTGFRARHFAPEAEAPFCGHATIGCGCAGRGGGLTWVIG